MNNYKMKNEKYKLVFSICEPFANITNLYFSFFTFHLTSHAAFHAECSRYRGQYRRQRLKNEFPSFLFHNSKV